MKARYKPSNRVGIQYWFLWPIGAAVIAALGAAHGAVAAFNPWAIANPVAFVLLTGCVGVAQVYLQKLGKLRNPIVGSISGVLLAGVFAAGTFVTIWLIDGGSQPFLSFHGDRLRTGVTPIPPAGWTLSGWLFGTVWVLGALAAALVGLITGVVTPSQVFCEECTSWGNKLLWRGTIARPDPEWVKRAGRSGSPKEVMAAVSGSGKGVAFIDVRGCACKSLISLEIRTAEDANDKMPGVATEAIPLSSADLRRLAAWAKERGMPGEVPQLETGLADPVIGLTSTTGPANGEYESRHRTNGNFMTLSLVHDNEYTHDLRAWLEYDAPFGPCLCRRGDRRRKVAPLVDRAVDRRRPRGR